MDTLSGKQLSDFEFLSLLNRGLLLKERICFSEEQILPFKSRPHFGRALSSREANRKSQKLFPFVNTDG